MGSLAVALKVRTTIHRGLQLKDTIRRSVAYPGFFGLYYITMQVDTIITLHYYYIIFLYYNYTGFLRVLRFPPPDN